MGAIDNSVVALGRVLVDGRGNEREKEARKLFFNEPCGDSSYIVFSRSEEQGGPEREGWVSSSPHGRFICESVLLAGQLRVGSSGEACGGRGAGVSRTFIVILTMFGLVFMPWTNRLGFFKS